MFTSVLAPVDFSDDSLDALKAAIALAAHSGGHVTALHVAHPLLVQAAAAAGQPTYVKDDVERDLCALVAHATAPLGSIAPRIDVRVVVGEPAEQILEAAVDTDLIVMGTRGVGGIRKVFFGSVTEHVLRHAPVPVLAVPGAAGAAMEITSAGPRLTRVLAPVDFSDSSLPNARVALEIAQDFGVPLLLLHVVSRIEAFGPVRHSLDAEERILLAHARDHMRHLISDLGDPQGVESLVVTGVPADEISAVAAERQASLIVMGLIGSGGLVGPRPGSIAYRVLCLATLPVLALPTGVVPRQGHTTIPRHQAAKTASNKPCTIS